MTIWRELARLTDYAGAEQHGAAKLGEVRATYLDVAKAGRELAWRPEVPLVEGLTRTVAFFRDR
jgi:UDP-glucose 4-epimerase